MPALDELLSPDEGRDPVTTCALILTKDAEAGRRREPAGTGREWFALGVGGAGGLLADELAAFVLGLIVRHGDARRLSQLQHLGRAVYFATVLAILLGPAAAAADDDVEGIDDIAALVVWAGMPPGSQEHPLVMASARSFQTAVEAHRLHAASLLQKALDAHEPPSGLPARQRRRSALQSQYLAGVGPGGNAVAAVDRLAADTGISVDGAEVAPGGWLSSLLSAAYPADEVTRGFRSMDGNERS